MPGSRQPVLLGLQDVGAALDSSEGQFPPGSPGRQPSMVLPRSTGAGIASGEI
jgi:hypothetical protein